MGQIQSFRLTTISVELSLRRSDFPCSSLTSSFTLSPSKPSATFDPSTSAGGGESGGGGAVEEGGDGVTSRATTRFTGPRACCRICIAWLCEMEVSSIWLFIANIWSFSFKQPSLKIQKEIYFFILQFRFDIPIIIQYLSYLPTLQSHAPSHLPYIIQFHPIQPTLLRPKPHMQGLK